MAIEYYSFEQVLSELNMDEEALKRLVSEGQIRAFRDQNRMKFRKDDIDMLKKGNKAEDVVILPESAAQPIDDTEQDLVVMDTGNEETMLDLEGFDLVEEDSSVPSIELEGGDAESYTEELVFDEGDEFGELEATQKIEDDFLEDDDEIGMQTEPLEGVIDADATMLEDEAPAPKRPALKRGGRAVGRAAKKTPAPEPEKQAVGEPMKPVKLGALWVVILAIAAIVSVIGALIMYDYSSNTMTGLTESIAKNFGESDGQKSLPWKFHESSTLKYPEWLKKDSTEEGKFVGDESTEGDDDLDK
jgi:hypothetical protein